jgi:uncharacterized protein (TIGR03083 family)
MPTSTPLQAFGAEAEQLSRVSSGFTHGEWDRPSTCPPWRVRDLFGHIHLTIGRLDDMLAEPAPDRPDVSPAEYYRPDQRFSAAASAERVDSAVEHARAYHSGAGLVADFEQTWRQIYRACSAQPAERTVRTRHGDAMLLSDFLRTRVVELVLHGIDLARSLERPPWTTDPGGTLVQRLLLGTDEPAAVEALGWSRTTLIAKATGRHEITPEERATLDAAGVTWLTLG